MRRNPFSGDLLLVAILRSKAFPQSPQFVVALTNLLMLVIASIVSLAYSLVDGGNHYVGVLITAIWCTLIQFMARYKGPLKRRWLRKRRLQEAAAGGLGAVVFISLVIARPF